jgi:hypothetical protein
LALGYVHPDRLLRDLTVSELAEWRAYNEIEPIGAPRDDYRMAQIGLLLHNLTQMQRGDGKWLSASIHDFALWSRVEPEKPQVEEPEQSVNEMKSVMLALARHQKKRIKK